MAKKDKKGEGAVQNREIFQRMNFLYQAAMYMATITPPKQPQHKSEEGSTLGVSSDAGTEQSTSEVASSEKPQPESTDVEMQGDVEPTTTTIHKDAAQSEKQKPAKVSRTKRRELLRERKVKIAVEQISENRKHHGLTNRNNTRCLGALSGTARFYASTLREIGRKNVIRVDPVIKRSFCLRCEAVLVPYVSSEVRIEEGDRWEPEEPEELEEQVDPASTSEALA
ncbi:hypothetical protein EC968_008525 [Mortierella alpina]|nr:hypothetical protein EC968_008525 [Mortierella alpina]